VTGLVYAPGALLAAARGDPVLWHLHRAALQRGQTPLVPAPVLAALPLPPADAALPLPPADAAPPLPPADAALPLPPADAALPLPPADPAGQPVTAGVASPLGQPGAGRLAVGPDRAVDAPQRRLAALLAGCALVDFPASAAWDVLRLRRLAPGADPVTAAVVLAALASRAVVVDDSAEQLRGIAEKLGVQLDVAVIPAG
jgi:hypothetical protein